MMWRCFEYGMYTRKARISTMWVHRNTPWNRSCQPSLIGSNARDARRDTGVHAAGDSFAPSEPFVPAHLPEVDGHLDADEHQDREHVLEQPEPAGPPDHRDGEPRVEDLAEGLDDRGQQDQEAPEDEGMHQPRAEALEQLPLAQDDHGLVLDALREIVQAADGPAQPHQLPQRECADQEQATGGRQKEEEHDRAHCAWQATAPPRGGATGGRAGPIRGAPAGRLPAKVKVKG